MQLVCGRVDALSAFIATTEGPEAIRRILTQDSLLAPIATGVNWATLLEFPMHGWNNGLRTKPRS